MKDIYTGAIIPMTHALTYLYKRFKDNPQGEIKCRKLKEVKNDKQN